MNAVLIATGSQPADTSHVCDELPELRRLIGRPWIEHVVEQLAHRGISHFSVVLSESPERLRDILGDGERWGVSMDFQSVKDACRPYGRVRRMAQSFENSPFLLAHANRLPGFDGIEAFDDRSETTPLRFDAAVAASDENPETAAPPLFTGYALLTPGDLFDWTDEMDEDALEIRLTEHAGETPPRRTPLLLDARTARGQLAANMAVLRKDYPGILMKNNEVQNGVWISRNVMIHPTAQLSPPLYIGEDCRIERQVTLGPGAIVEPQCVIDRKASVRNSVVHRHSYVGENLEVSESIIDRNHLINTRIGTAVSISESFLLGSLSKNLNPTLLHRLPSKVAGFVLLVLLLPLQLIALGAALLRCPQKPFRSHMFLALPAPAEEADWQTATRHSFDFDAARAEDRHPARRCNGRDFLRVFLPGLWSVVFGRMHLVGLPPRPPTAVRELPADWRNLYRRGKIGLITQNLVLHGGSELPDDMYAAETFYVATASFRQDFRLFIGYLRNVIASLFKRTPDSRAST